MSQHLFLYFVFLLTLISCDEYKYRTHDKTCPVVDSTKEDCFSKKTDTDDMECCFGVSLEDNDHNFCFPMTNEPITKAYVETKDAVFSFKCKIECLSDTKTTDDEENLGGLETEEPNNSYTTYLSQVVVLIYFLFFCL